MSIIQSHSSRNLVQRLARRIFHRQVYYRPTAGSADLSLLDYGCGDGTFLCEMKGWFNSLYGFEPVCSHAEALSARLNVPIYRLLADQYGFHIGETSFAAFPNTLAASLATVLSGYFHPVLFMGLILPRWLVCWCAPQGTRIIRMVRAPSVVG